jgi:hypothetical protein
MLTIPEEVMLVETRVFDARIAVRKYDSVFSAPNQTLAAGSLIELVLTGRIALEHAPRNPSGNETILVLDAAPTGDGILDAMLKRVVEGKARSSGYWVKHLAKGAGEAYWDRLIARSLLRPDALGRDPQSYRADEGAVAAISVRMRAVLDHRPPVDLRDAALVTLLAYARRTLSPLVRNWFWSWNPVALIREHRMRGREDFLGRASIAEYKGWLESDAGGDVDRRDRAMAAADAILSIASAARAEPTGGGGV